MFTTDRIACNMVVICDQETGLVDVSNATYEQLQEAQAIIQDRLAELATIAYALP